MSSKNTSCLVRLSLVTYLLIAILSAAAVVTVSADSHEVMTPNTHDTVTEVEEEESTKGGSRTWHNWLKKIMNRTATASSLVSAAATSTVKEGAHHEGENEGAFEDIHVPIPSPAGGGGPILYGGDGGGRSSLPTDMPSAARAGHDDHEEEEEEEHSWSSQENHHHHSSSSSVPSDMPSGASRGGDNVPHQQQRVMEQDVLEECAQELEASAKNLQHFRNEMMIVKQHYQVSQQQTAAALSDATKSRDELAELKQAFEWLKKDYDTLHKSVNAHVELRVQEETKLIRAKAELDWQPILIDWQNKYRAMEIEKNAYEAELAQTQRELFDQEKLVTKQIKDETKLVKESLESELSNKSNLIKSLERESAKLEREKVKLQQRLKSTEARYEARLDALHHQLKTKSSSDGYASGDDDKELDRLTQARKAIERLEREKFQLERAVAGSGAMLGELEETYAEIKSRNGILKEKVDRLTTERTELRQELNVATNKLIAREQRHQRDIREKVRDIEKKAQEQSKKTELEAVTRWKESLHRQWDKYSALEFKVKDLEEKLLDAAKRPCSHHVVVESQESGIGDDEDETSAVSRMRNNLRTQMSLNAVLQEKTDQVEAELTKTQKRCNLLQENCERDLARIQANAEALLKEYAKETEQREAIKWKKELHVAWDKITSCEENKKVLGSELDTTKEKYVTLEEQCKTAKEIHGLNELNQETVRACEKRLSMINVTTALLLKQKEEEVKIIEADKWKNLETRWKDDLHQAWDKIHFLKENIKQLKQELDVAAPLLLVNDKDALMNASCSTLEEKYQSCDLYNITTSKLLNQREVEVVKRESFKWKKTLHQSWEKLTFMRGNMKDLTTELDNCQKKVENLEMKHKDAMAKKCPHILKPGMVVTGELSSSASGDGVAVWQQQQQKAASLAAAIPEKDESVWREQLHQAWDKMDRLKKQVKVLEDNLASKVTESCSTIEEKYTNELLEKEQELTRKLKEQAFDIENKQTSLWKDRLHKEWDANSVLKAQTKELKEQVNEYKNLLVSFEEQRQTDEANESNELKSVLDEARNENQSLKKKVNELDYALAEARNMCTAKQANHEEELAYKTLQGVNHVMLEKRVAEEKIEELKRKIDNFDYELAAARNNCASERQAHEEALAYKNLQAIKYVELEKQASEKEIEQLKKHILHLDHELAAARNSCAANEQVHA